MYKRQFQIDLNARRTKVYKNIVPFLKMIIPQPWARTQTHAAQTPVPVTSSCSKPENFVPRYYSLCNPSIFFRLVILKSGPLYLSAPHIDFSAVNCQVDPLQKVTLSSVCRLDQAGPEQLPAIDPLWKVLNYIALMQPDSEVFFQDNAQVSHSPFFFPPWCCQIWSIQIPFFSPQCDNHSLLLCTLPVHLQPDKRKSN